MTKEAKLESESELFSLGFDASTTVECADYLIRGLAIDDRRLEVSRKYIANEAMMIGTALLYIKDPYYPKRLLETGSTVDEARKQDQALKRIMGAFELGNGDQVSEKLGLLFRWSKGERDSINNGTVLVYGKYVVEDSKQKLFEHYNLVDN